MKEFSIEKEWSIAESWYPVSFRKPVPLTVYDKIILKLLSLHDGILEKDSLGQIMGLGMKNDKSINLYQDPAEIKILEILLKELYSFHLITTTFKISTREEEVLLDYWGYKALEDGQKYSFHEGLLPVYNHLYLKYEESEGSFFPFFHFPLDFHKKQEKSIPPYRLEQEVPEEATFLLKKIQFNQKKANTENDLLIDFVLPSREFVSEKLTSITVHLKGEKKTPKITTSIGSIDLPELDEVLKDERNYRVYKDILLFVEYNAILERTNKISTKKLRKYKPYVEWDTILEDERLQWTEKLLELFSESDISTGSLWKKVTSLCPRELLISNLDSYKEFLNWTLLTEIIEIDEIIRSYSQYPWDTDVLVKRADSRQIERWLLNYPEESKSLDWYVVSQKPSDAFIKANLSQIKLDLRFLTKEKVELSKELMSKKPSLSWDWKFISANYDLSFLLENIETFQAFLDLSLLMPRILNEPVTTLTDFLSNPTFEEMLGEFSKKEDRHFYINATSNVILDKPRITFLNNYNLAFWGEGNITGIEANKNLKWDEDNFLAFKQKIKSDQGRQAVSLSIPSLKTVIEYPDFDWDFIVLAERENFLNDLQFLENHKAVLPYNKVLLSIPTELLLEELFFFKEWGENSGQVSEFTSGLENRFDFLNLMHIISLYQLEELDFNWSKIVNQSSIVETEKVFILFHNWINKLINYDQLVENITNKLSEASILENNDLPWDWKLVTTKKLSKDSLKQESFLDDNVYHLYWPYIIEEVFTEEELTIYERLPEIATYLSVTPKFIKKESWTAITDKLSSHKLWEAINLTTGKESFKWDWDLISSTNRILDNFSLEGLSENQLMINWDQLSENPSIYKSWNYGLFGSYHDWRNYVLKYLTSFQSYWNFKSLSKIKTITWSADIVDSFNEKWDWDILSRESRLFTKKIDGEVRYNISNLTKYSERINWKILSERYKVSIYEREFSLFLDMPWSFSALSGHPKLSLSFELLDKTIEKDWNWKAITRRGDIELSKNLLLYGTTEKGKLNNTEPWEWIKKIDWDWTFLSSAKWLDGEILIAFHTKEWDWKLISENQAIIFDLNLLQILKDKEAVNWSAIIKNHKTHINAQTLRLLESVTTFSNTDWKSISAHPNLNFTTAKGSGTVNFAWNFVDKYADFWDWNLLALEEKIDIFNISLLKRYQNRLDWAQISRIPSIESKVDILKEFANKLDWGPISQKISPTEEVLFQFQEHLNWDLISINESISFSPDLISKFENKWNYFFLKENIALKESDKAREYLEDYLCQHKEIEFYFRLKEQSSNWAGNIYHFTHLTNALEIVKSKKILSRNMAKSFADAAGSVVGRRHDAHKFARFYFRPQTPTQFYNECLGKDLNSGYQGWSKDLDGEWTNVWKSHFLQAKRLGLPKCPIPVFFKFDLQEVLLRFSQKCFASTGNMQTNWANFHPISEVIPYFNFEDVYSEINTTSDGDWKTYLDYSQQEFLVKKEFNFASLKKFQVIVRTEEDKKQLLGKLDAEDPIREKVFVNNDNFNIFHNENRKIYYSFDGRELSISTDYQGDGISNARFFIEFSKTTRFHVKSGNLLQSKENYLTAYPSIDIEFLNSPTFKVRFFDESNREWLILEGNNEIDQELIKDKMGSHFIEYQPPTAIQFLKDLNNDIQSYYETRVRHYSLEDHTLLVANQFEKYFTKVWKNTLEDSIDIDLFRYFLLLHDIGKPKAEASGDRKNQYKYSSKIIIQLWNDLTFSDQQLSLVLGLLKGDPIGEYFQKIIPLKKCISEIIDANKNTSIKLKDFFRVFMIYYQCDTAAYTKDAGGYPFLENLFIYEKGEKQFDKEEGFLKFAEPYKALYLDLKSEIYKYANQVY